MPTVAARLKNAVEGIIKNIAECAGKYKRKYRMDSGKTSAGVFIRRRITGVRSIPAAVRNKPDSTANAVVV